MNKARTWRRRSRVIALTSFLALCLAGVLLSFFEQRQLLWVGFAVMFLTAGLCSASALLLRDVSGLPQHEPSNNPMGFWSFSAPACQKNFRYFPLFSGLIHSDVLVAGPFFVIHLLQDRRLAPWQYGTWQPASSVNSSPCRPGANSAIVSGTRRCSLSPACLSHSCRCCVCAGRHGRFM